MSKFERQGLWITSALHTEQVHIDQFAADALGVIDDLMCRHDTLACDIASALGWEVGGKPWTDCIRELRAENERLESIAKRAGAWQTVDGVWVFGADRVFMPSGLPQGWEACKVYPRHMRYCYSTREAAEAKKEKR